MGLPCSTIDLKPQKGKMGFDQTLIKANFEDSEGSAVINPDNIFLNDKKQLSNCVLIEYVNQLVASIQGYNEKFHNKKAAKGLFVGVQEAEFYQTVNLGDLLTLKGFLSEDISQVKFIQGSVERKGEKIAQLVTKIYEVENLSDFDLLIGKSQPIQKNNIIKINDKQPPTYLSSSMHRKLYSCINDTEIGDDFISFNIACPDDFDAFDGHFPENPILPGILLLEIGNLALELFLKKTVVFKYIKKMKIAGMVLPNQVISCYLKLDPGDTPQMSFSAAFKGENDREFSRYSGYIDKGQ